MKNKSINNQVQSTSTQITPEAVPSPGAPTPPKGFDPKQKLGSGNVLPLQTVQLKLAGSVAAEIEASTTLAADLGPHVPDIATFVAMLTLAGSWSTERMHAEVWRTYARNREVASWKPTLESLELFKRAFETAVNADPSIAEKYPQTAAFLDTRSRAAAKGHRTKKVIAAAPAAEPVAPKADESAK